ncbi:OmpA family protein [Ectopseudomonas mendocina]|uniref:OmpA family protein n=1 Tax=Ectopseudomonas mendocina TaxID=300 RepID=A0ABZ2RGX9_ECTME
MRKRGSDGHEIIVKRRGKKGHDEAHGGAWKVAFADFTLAMMALFMVLWIVQPRLDVISQSDGSISNPIVDGGIDIFDGSSVTVLELDGVPVQTARRDDVANTAKKPEDKQSETVSDKEAPELTAQQLELLEQVRPYYGEPGQMRVLVELMDQLAKQLNAEANIEVQVVPQGLRVLIKDDKDRFMFTRGSARLDPHFETLLQRLAGILGKVENHLIISGHTDAAPYRGVVNGYNNWNLSGDRALRARNVMVAAGLPASSVLQVTAQADVMPLLPDDPRNGANRRIEVLVLTSQAEGLYRELFGEGQLRADFKGAEKATPAQ